MKLCWDNLAKLRFNNKTGCWYNEHRNKYELVDSCKTCGEEFLASSYGFKLFCERKCQPSNQKGRHHSEETKNRLRKVLKDRIFSEETRRKLSEANKGKKHSAFTKAKLREINLGSNSPAWKGGVNEKDVPIYDTYSHKISWCEEVKRDSKDERLLQVKCTYCGKWYTPTRTSVRSRIRAINGDLSGEHHFYCSSECKNLCPIYRQRDYYKFQTEDLTREVQAELRQLVFARDNWTCTKCSRKDSLHCHHIEGIKWEPLESADIDKCKTVCEECHIQIHKIEGCTYYDMRCN